MMEALLEKERELQRLNAELDEKQRKLSAGSSNNPTTGCSPNPRKKLSVSASGRGKGLRPRCGSLGSSSSRPASRSTESEKDVGDGEKFVWAPIKGPVEGGSNNFIWAPISQEELFQEA